MPLVLAIEPDPRQAATLRRVVKGRARAELILVDSKDAALASLASRIPDLILVSALLPPRDEDDLTQHLKALDHAAHLQTLTIPLLAGAPAEEQTTGSVFGKFRRKKKAAPIEGCDPNMFGEEIETYLQRAAEVRAEECAREAAPRADVFVEQPVVAEGAAQDLEQAAPVVADVDQDFTPAYQEPDAEPPVAAIDRNVDLLEQDGEPAGQEVAAAPADAATLEAQPVVETDIPEPTYRPAFTGRLGIPFGVPRPAVEEPRSVLIEPLPLRDDASSEPQTELLETPVAQDHFTRTEADWGLAEEPRAILEAEGAPSESEFVTPERDAAAGSEALSIFMRETRTAAPQEAFAEATTLETDPAFDEPEPEAAKFQANRAFDEPEPASAEPDAVVRQEALAEFEGTSVVADETTVPGQAATALLEETAVAAEEPVIAERDVAPVATDARVEFEPADLAEQRVAFEEPQAGVTQEPAPLRRDFVSAADAATEPAIHDADSTVVEPEIAADGDGGDTERRLEPWELLLRQIAAQQEALNAEAERAAAAAAANAEAARAAAMAAADAEAARAVKIAQANAEAAQAAAIAAADAVRAATEQAEECAPANPDVTLDVFDDRDAPAGVLDSRDAEVAPAEMRDSWHSEPAAQQMGEGRPEHDDTAQTSSDADANAPLRRGTAAAVHGALTRALAPLHAFVGRVTSGRKAAATAAAAVDENRALTSAARLRSPAEQASYGGQETDDIVPLDDAVEGVMSQPDDSQVATLGVSSAGTADEDWHDVTRLVGAMGPIEGQETVTRPAEPPIGEAAEAEAATVEGARENGPRPQRRSKDDGRKEKKRRRSRARTKRAQDFESVLERLDGAWVASAIAALRVDIERLRQDTLAAVPMASEPVPDGPKSAGTGAPGAGGNGHDQPPDAAADSQPVEDEWGFYDPGRCGIQALMARLDGKAGDNGATQQPKVPAMQHASAQRPDGSAPAAKAAAAAAQQDRRPAPLAMWARAGEPLEYDPRDVVPAEPLPQMPGISPALRLPDHVAAVRYGSGCRIRRVRVAPGPESGREDRRQVVILSRKALDEEP